MENLQEIKALFDLIDIFNKTVPDGVYKNLKVNETLLDLSKNGNEINIHIVSDDSVKGFDDSKIKKVIADYKEGIEELDDCLFISAVEDMEKSFDIKRFDSLLNLDTFTEEEASEINELINNSIEIIRKHLENKITDFVYAYNKF